MRSDNHMTTLLALAISFALFAAITLGQPTGPNSLDTIGSERASITSSAKQIEAQAGNVTEVNVDATSVTQAWQGYFGNITGSITLQDASNNVFYNWSGIGSVSGEVYASRNDSVTWASINCSNSTEISTENSFLGKAASDPDSVDNTFSSTSHPSFLIGTTNITQNSCSSTNAYINTGSSATDYYQILLADGNANMVYITLIDNDQTGFDGVGHDFQLLVGENGNETSTGSTTYYFYIELS